MRIFHCWRVFESTKQYTIHIGDGIPHYILTTSHHFISFYVLKLSYWPPSTSFWETSSMLMAGTWKISTRSLVVPIHGAPTHLTHHQAAWADRKPGTVQLINAAYKVRRVHQMKSLIAAIQPTWFHHSLYPAEAQHVTLTWPPAPATCDPVQVRQLRPGSDRSFLALSV